MITLVVERSDAIRSRLTAMIQQLDKACVIVGVENIDEAFSKTDLYVFDAIIVDLSNQDGQGLATLDTLRKKFPVAYICVAINDSREWMKKKLLRNGANAVFDKAMECGLLIDDLKTILAGRCAS